VFLNVVADPERLAHLSLREAHLDELSDGGLVLRRASRPLV